MNQIAKETKAYINGNIITMEANMPKASAMVTSGNRILYVGSDEEAGKPVLASSLKLKRSREIQDAYRNVIDNGVSEETVRRRAEMILAIDEGLGRLIENLDQHEELDRPRGSGAVWTASDHVTDLRS